MRLLKIFGAHYGVQMLQALKTKGFRERQTSSILVDRTKDIGRLFGRPVFFIQLAQKIGRLLLDKLSIFLKVALKIINFFENKYLFC